MRDPVTGFLYPDDWVKKCPDPTQAQLAETGLGVLTAGGLVLRRGFTTGTTAAAVAKAAVLSLVSVTESIQVTLPSGIVVDVPVTAKDGHASGKKYAGDYSLDITAGLEFRAEATRQPEGITVLFGEGIGRFSRDTPRYKAGVPAVSPPALSAIVRAVQEALEQIGVKGVSVHISSPAGAMVAQRTLNPKMGVEGGISVLGTTGLVEPWDDHLTETALGRITAADHPVLTTGRVGLRFSRLLFPDRDVILIGGKLRQGLDAARGEVTLCGLPALILRHINPDILSNTGFATVEELSASPRFPEIVKGNLAKFRNIRPNVTVILINREGSVIGESP